MGDRVDDVIVISEAVSGALLGMGEFCMRHYRKAIIRVANANVHLLAIAGLL